MRYFIQLSYDGTAYHGWQRQPEAISVEEALESRLALLLGKDTEVTGCGRTDTGVSAKDYYAHFETEKTLDCTETERRLNIMLPSDIAIKRIFPCGLHARFDAIRREYKYYISLKKDPFAVHCWTIHNHLDVEKLEKTGRILLRYNDFTSFAKLHANAKTNICTIFDVSVEQNGDKIVFTISANRFLRGMVRAIVGTLVDVGLGKITSDDFQRIIEKKDRSFASMQAPAKGLFLTKITYPGI